MNNIFDLTQLNEIENINLKKNKRVYNILITPENNVDKFESQKILIKCNNITLKNGFNINQFKQSENGNEGTIVLDLSDKIEYIDSFDTKIRTEFENVYGGTVINNMKLTYNSIKQMFRSSTYMNTLRVNISKDSCVFFDENRELILDPNYLELLKSNIKLGAVIEPAFLWIMNQKIGIHWDVKQIKLINEKENNVNENISWSLLMDDDE